MSKFKDYFDEIAPLTDNEKFAAEVKRAARPKKKSRRTFIAIASAAAAAAMLTVTASAAYEWNLGEAVRAFFGGRKAEENIISADVISAENSFEDLNISIKGAVRDKAFTIVFLDIERTDGEAFDCSPYVLTETDGTELIGKNGITYSESPEYGFDSVLPTINYIGGGSSQYAPTSEYVLDDGDPTDSRITLAVCMDTSHPFYGIEDRDFVSKSVKLELKGFKGNKHHGIKGKKSIYLIPYETVNMYGEFSCEIDLGHSETESRTVYPNGTAALRAYSQSNDPDNIGFTNFDFTVKELTVSSCSVSVSLERSTPDETEYIDTSNFGALIMKDGTEIKFDGYKNPSSVNESGNITHIDGLDNGGRWTVDASVVLPKTVNIDEIEAVRIGDLTVDI